MPKFIPDILKDYILPFNWDVRKVWALNADVVQVPCFKFAYLLELPVWSSVPGRGLLFDICPMDVIRNPNTSIYQTRRLREAKLRYPIDVLVVEEMLWILDGVHRITKHFALDNPTLAVRFHNENIIQDIKLGW